MFDRYSTPAEYPNRLRLPGIAEATPGTPLTGWKISIFRNVWCPGKDSNLHGR
jgi:hypothetical protein